MKFKALFLLIICGLFLSGYEYKYNVPKLDGSNNAAVRNDKGIMYMEMGYYSAAMTEFQIAISLSPDETSSAAYYNNLGLLYSKLNNLPAAKECFENAINLNPVFMEYYKNLVKTLEKAGTLNIDLNNYLAQINEDVNNSNALLMAGLIYVQLGQKELAIGYLERFVSLEKWNYLSGAVAKMINELKVK